ncbi:FAD-binding oxidoreductase [Buchnera aphidicola (Neophyllaphis podocarpi)]|uniref:FAD-binding oxidoreductase n=1 Tax=Buchnera aphidicola TaxID=9 RepID=UPI0031B836BD
MTNWVKANIIKLNQWNNKLFSIILSANINPFIAGQFTKLCINNKKNKDKIQRAYSYVNSPNSKNLEFYIVSIPNGKFTKKLINMNCDDEILISKESSGFFTLNQIPSSNLLWMIATGTGIGPYLSILQYGGKELNKFNKIILIYAVSYFEDISYLNLINKLKTKYKNKLHVEFILSREKKQNILYGHIPQLIEEGFIEDKVENYIEKENSHIMLCGNPGMVHDTRKFLIENKNMRKNLRKLQGHITSEHYW